MDGSGRELQGFQQQSQSGGGGVERGGQSGLAVDGQFIAYRPQVGVHRLGGYGDPAQMPRAGIQCLMRCAAGLAGHTGCSLARFPGGRRCRVRLPLRVYIGAGLGGNNMSSGVWAIKSKGGVGGRLGEAKGFGGQGYDMLADRQR